MATLEDIVAASKILSEGPGPVIEGSDSKPIENQDGASEVRNGGDVSAADAVSEQKMENEAAVESTFDDDEKEKLGIKSDICAADAVVSEENMEIETVVVPTSDDDEKENLCVKSDVSAAADAVVIKELMRIESVVESAFDDEKENFGTKSDVSAADDAVFIEEIMRIESVVESIFDDEKENFGTKSDVSAADAVREENMENETVVESSLDDEKENLGTESLSPVPCCSSSVEANGVDVGVDGDDSKEELVSGENNEILEDSFTENGEGKSTDYMDVDGNGDGEEGINSELKDTENDFHVGDFVWAKIRSHPWWPGQVYDSKDASDFAMKRKQEGRLLVAFFGDGTCSWCLPSQLVPFVENFSEMSRDSSSKSFLNAVEKALDEVGRLVVSELTCKCISKEMRSVGLWSVGLARPIMENAGLKAGVLVPDIDASRLSLPNLEPKELVGKVMQLAKTVSIDNALNLAIMRSLLSAFYYFKGGYQLTMYHDPSYIEGLEDKSKNANEAGNDFSVPIEVPILGPMDDDCHSSPAGGSVDPTGLVENKVSHKRKQKSVAELMGENKNIKPRSHKRGSVKEGADYEKPLSSLKKKKAKNDGEVGSGGASSTGRKGRKRKVEEILESPELTNIKDSSAETRPLPRKPKGLKVAVAEDVSGESKEEVEIVSSPRERKKSKYLSPPYTNVARRTGNASPRIETQVEHDKTIKITEKEAKEDISDSQPILKSSENTSEGKLSNGKLERLNSSKDKSPDAIKNEKEPSFPVADVDASVNELLSDIKLASRDPLYLAKKGSVEKVCAFASALRSSINLHGENYKLYGKGKVTKTEKRSNTSNSKKAAETSAGGSTLDTTEGTTLILQFTAGFPLPSRKDIVKIFDKFGSLNMKKTKFEKDSHSIRVVYVNDSDAEAAFKSSLNQSPFPSENVNFKLLRSSPVPKKKRSVKQTPEKREASKPADDLVSDFYTMRRKLELTGAILENYHAMFSSEDKLSLKDDMKHFMEEVETVCEKVRVMAERTKS